MNAEEQLVFPQTVEGLFVRGLAGTMTPGLKTRLRMDTLMGKALAPVMRALGPRRTLLRMERNFRSGSNYVAVRAEATGPAELLLHFNEVHGIPGYYAGIIEQGAALTGAKDTTVEVLPAPAPGCALRVRWKE